MTVVQEAVFGMAFLASPLDLATVAATSDDGASWLSAERLELLSSFNPFASPRPAAVPGDAADDTAAVLPSFAAGHIEPSAVTDDLFALPG